MSYMDEFRRTLNEAENLLLRRQTRHAARALAMISEARKKMELEHFFKWPTALSKVKDAAKSDDEYEDFDDLEDHLHDLLDDQRFDEVNGGIQGVTFKRGGLHIYTWIIPEKGEDEEGAMYSSEHEVQRIIQDALRQAGSLADMLLKSRGGHVITPDQTDVL